MFIYLDKCTNINEDMIGNVAIKSSCGKCYQVPLGMGQCDIYRKNFVVSVLLSLEKEIVSSIKNIILLNIYFLGKHKC